MHNLWARGNAILFYCLTVLFLLAAASNVSCVLRGAAGVEGRPPHPMRGVSPTACPLTRAPPPSHPRSTYWFTPTPHVRTLRVASLTSLRSARDPSSRSDVGRALLTLDVDADLSGVWNWNVKQLFVYITVDYATPKHARNSLVVWDALCESRAGSVIKLANKHTKYPLVEHDALDVLTGNALNVTLHWDVMPITGMLYAGRGGHAAVRLPDGPCDGAECRVEVLSGGARESEL